MEDCNGVSTPASTAITNQNDTSEQTEYVDKTYYLKLVGLINYLAIHTRPDLLYLLSKVAQQCSQPTIIDQQNVKRFIRYISMKTNVGIAYNCDDDYQLICYVDSSYNSYIDGKFHYGLTFSLGEQNGSFYAKSQKSLIRLSSTEAVSRCFTKRS